MNMDSQLFTLAKERKNCLVAEFTNSHPEQKLQNKYF